MRPVWAEISRPNLLHNYHLLRSIAAPADLLAVVKANAYGHGAVACSEVLAGAGAQWLGVTSVEEGVTVRAACPNASILALCGLWRGEANAALEHRITPVVWEHDHLAEAARPGQPIAVHLEIDTGMSRQGVRMAELPATLNLLRALRPLDLEGVLTHFHSPEILDNTVSQAQFAQFVTAMDTIAADGLRPEIIHAGNSATLLQPGVAALVKLAEKQRAKAMLRPGLALYGYVPRFTGAEMPRFARGLRPVLTWKTRVASLRTIGPGETVGYGATFRATRPTKLALLPVGYADGFNRLLSNRGDVLLHGRRAPIAGRISMDLTTIDVTDIPDVKLGDETVLIGTQEMETITAYDHADLTGTIPYEILCNISARVPRVMVD